MEASVPASTLQKDGPGPFPRAYLPWLALLLVIHAGIVAWAVTQISETPWFYFRYEGFAGVALVALAIFGAAFAIRRRFTQAIAWSGGILVASALLTPAVTLVVGLQLLNAFVLGDRLLARVQSGRAATDATHVAVATLTGASIWIGIMAATAAFKVHFVGVYAAALLLPLLFWWRATAEALRRVGQLLVRPGPPMAATERSWTALLMAMVAVHLFVVAKPETGYDAMAMHLQIPMVVAEAHRWPFDVTRYAWAVMPFGADWTFTAAYFLGGEGAARLLNFSFALLACQLLYALMRLHARRDIALASVCLVASSPLAFLETSTLYIENLWTAFLLGTLLLALEYLRTKSSRTLVALALLAAGAMQCKVIGVIWLAPLLAYVAYVGWRQRSFSELTSRQVALIAIAIVFAAWPYANAWLRTGNPVFPFMNGLFRSPYFDTVSSFNNLLYNAPLRPWSLYELIWSSGRFIEGSNGAAGMQWLLLIPVIALAFIRRRPLVQWLCLALAVIFFVGVFSQQSYLRYLLPFFALFAVLGGWALSEIPDGRATRATILLIGGILIVINVRLIYTASWANLTLCAACAVDNGVRAKYLALWGPDRVSSDYLNRNLPDARVGFYMLGGNPAGYTTLTTNLASSAVLGMLADWIAMHAAPVPAR
ncbi:MAG: glycosyltransferase family 39 protein [Casimicrobiaceae bacterium]